jgi:predicted phosphoribosyltransferase
VARELNAPLDVLVVRKVGMPGQRELAVGAIAAGGVQVREPTFATYLTTMGVNFDELADAERVELERREHAYRAGAAPLDLTGKTVVLVDDGLATGSTMLAAVRSARKAHAGSVVVAAPVASDEAAALVGGEADKLVVLKIPAFLSSIGQWYDDFRQIDDDEVQALLKQPSPATQAASDSE